MRMPWQTLWAILKGLTTSDDGSAGKKVRSLSEPALDAVAERVEGALDHAQHNGEQLLADGEEHAHRIVENLDSRLTRQRQELLKDTGLALGEAAKRMDESVDHASRSGERLLASGEERARRVVDDLDKRLAKQRQDWLAGAEGTCDSISKRLVRRVLLACLALLGAAGLAAVLVFWAGRNL